MLPILLLVAAASGSPDTTAVRPEGRAPAARVGLPPLPEPETGGRVWTLGELLASAQTSQPDLRDARLRAEQARADATTAALRPNPQLQLGVSNLPTNAPQGAAWRDVLVWGAGVSQELELGGKRRQRMASAEAGIRAGEAAVGDVQRTSRFEVEKAFLQALAAEQHQQIAAQSLARYLESVRLIRARFEAGEDAGADVNKIELEKLRYAQEARESARAAVEARAELFRLVGIAASPQSDRVAGEFPRAGAAADVDALVREALEHRADLQALQHAKEKAEADLALARAKAIPDPTLGLSYAYSPTEIPSGATSTFGITATVPLPIFDRNQGEVAKAELELQRAELALARGRADVEREVRLAVGHLGSASTAVDELEQNYLARADTALQIAERSFREGKASLLEFLEAQRTSLETRAGYVDALLDRGVGQLELTRAVGTGGNP